MIADSTTDRECRICHKSKPLDDYYKRGKYHFWQCKACQKQISHDQVHVNRQVSLVPSEADVITELHRRGIPALPGKALSHNHADVVAWGCVLIEVKSVKPVNGSYLWSFSSQRIKNRIRGQLVILICDDDNGRTYHLFDALHPVFYKNGKVKTGVQYRPHRKHTKGRNSDNAMNAELMNAAKDQWQMIEYWRLKIADRLRNGEALPLAA